MSGVAKGSNRTGQPGRQATPRRGGPGTFSGIDFQVLVAEYEVVRLIGILLWQPQHASQIELEPRATSQGSLVGYDVGMPGRRTRCEVKANPTRSDIVEFAQTIAATDIHDLGFARLHGGRGGKAVMDLDEVRRLATEAVDGERFAVLAADLNDEQRALVIALGDDAWERAKRIEVVVTTPQDIENRVADHASSLAGPDGGQQLREHVRAQIVAAAKVRATLDVSKTVAELRRRGVQLLAPATTDAAGLDEDVISSLLVLQHCTAPLPLSILAEVIGVVPSALSQKLAGHVVQASLDEEPPMIAIVGYPSPMHRPGEAVLFERTLEVLTAVVGDKSRRPLALRLLRTLRQFAVLVDSSGRRPDLVARCFPATDKVFKTAGDLHLALEVASLSLRASHVPRPGTQRPSQQMLRDRAQTQICGMSWVHQRVGDYELADDEARRSLDLGESLGWARNTAFCQK